jgi:hypothetical protein
MDRDRAVHLELDLMVAPEGPLTGRVTLAGAPPKAFTGWIGLTAAIDGMLTVAARQAQISSQEEIQP